MEQSRRRKALETDQFGLYESTCEDEAIADDEKRGVEQQGCAQGQETYPHLQVVGLNVVSSQL